MIDRNELLAQAVDRCVLAGLAEPSAAPALVLLYKNSCVVEPDTNRVTLNGKDLDSAMIEIIKKGVHWQRRTEMPTSRVDIEAEQAALLASHKNWGQSEKTPDTGNKDKLRPTNPFSAEGWNITAQGKLIKALGMEKAQEIAKAAGSFVGATKPPAPSEADRIANRAYDAANPWTKEGWNLTLQGQVYKKLGAVKAAELAAAAGVRIGATRPAN